MSRVYTFAGKTVAALMLCVSWAGTPARANEGLETTAVLTTPRLVQMASWFAPRTMPAPTRPRKVAFVEHGQSMLAPFGHVRFCVQHPEECEASPEIVAEVAQVSTDALDIARQTNDVVNAAIEPRPDAARADGDVWTLAPEAGDCDDYAVTKRSLLLKAGWSSSSVLLAHVVTPQGEDHLVTVVRTADGDHVLDNLDRTLRPVYQTRYRWVSIQSASNPRLWHRAQLRVRPLMLAQG